ncbi:hypothetical protein KKH82_03770 [Patescibacteria group bacterium]|nr:hypothetical protein [Patescibacteria group bacterium]
MKQDPTIQINIGSPTNGATVGQKFSLSFTAQGSKNFRKLSVVIDDTYVTSFSYN